MLTWLPLLLVPILAFGADTNSTLFGKLGKPDPFSFVKFQLDDEVVLTLTDIGKKGGQLDITILESSPKTGKFFEKLELNGKQVEILTGPIKNKVQVSVANGTRLVESLDFVVEQLYREAPNNKKVKFITSKSKRHWRDVMDVLRAGHIKAEKLFTYLYDEFTLVDVIIATSVKAVAIESDHSDDEKAVVLSDAFFNESAVQNLTSFWIARENVTSNLTDETLSKLKVKELTLDTAPKLTQAGVRRFLQPTLEGWGNCSIFFVPTFKFDEKTFFEGVNVKKVDSFNDGHWEGNEGKPKSVIIDKGIGLTIRVFNE